MITNIVLIYLLYIWWCSYHFTYLSMCCFFSLFIHIFLIVCNLLFLFHTKIPWWVLFKVFQKYRLSKSIMPWTLFLQSFSRVYDRIWFYCTQQVIMSLVIYEFSHISFVCCGFVTDYQRREIVRTLVRTYVIVILANPLTKRTLLVIE